MRDFMTRGGAISVDHLSELHRAADDLAALPPAKRPEDFGLVHVSMREFDALVLCGIRPPEPTFRSLIGVWVSPDWAVEARHALARSAQERLAVSSAEPAGGDFGGPATSVWSGRGGRQRGPDVVRDAMRAGLRAHVVIDDATADALMLAARVYVHSLWDHAVALAAEDEPVPLASAEAWEEGNQAYAKRLGVPPHIYLDRDGVTRGLPRARLVLNPQRTEENRP